MLRRRIRLRWRWLPGTALVALLCLPYRANIVENARFMTGFVGGWRNNDSLFGLVLAVTGDLYRAKYLTFLLFGLCVAGAMLARWKLESRFLFVITATLLLSANCHPWYATWFLPLLTLEPFVPLLLWSALMPLAYGVLIDWRALGVWNGVSGWRWAIHGPFLAMLIGRLFLKRRRNSG